MPIVVKHTTNAATNITCINSFEQYVDDINTIKQIFTNTDNQNKNLHTAITFSLNVKSLCSFFFAFHIAIGFGFANMILYRLLTK